MDVVKKEKQGNNVTMEIEVESEQVNEALDKAYQSVVQDVSVPGFRKGKVPRSVLEARFGEEVLYKDALDFLIPQAYSEALEETGIEPISEPEILDYTLEKGESAHFEVKVEVKPNIELGQYTGLEVEKEEIEISEEEVTDYLTNIKKQHAQLENSDKKFVEEGDYVIIDFEGKIDGEPFEGGSEEEFGLEIGSEQFVPGFEEKLIGHRVGEEFEIDINFPEDYQAPDLAGQTAVFDVEIKEIKQKIEPELDDDFAKEATEFDTIEEYKEEIKSRIKEEKEQKSDSEFQENILEKIAENVEVDIPDSLIDNQLDQMFSNLSRQFSQQGMSIQDLMEERGMDKESWREENYDIAKTRVQNNLILEAIAEEEEIEVSEEEINEKVEEIAEQYDQDPEEMREMLEQQNQINGLLADLKIQKTLEFLKENNKIVS